jgi:hypothetical protein
MPSGLIDHGAEHRRPRLRGDRYAPYAVAAGNVLGLVVVRAALAPFAV